MERSIKAQGLAVRLPVSCHRSLANKGHHPYDRRTILAEPRPAPHVHPGRGRHCGHRYRRPACGLQDHLLAHAVRGARRARCRIRGSQYRQHSVWRRVMDDGIPKDMLYLACTRPAMKWGVPVEGLMINLGVSYLAFMVVGHANLPWAGGEGGVLTFPF